MNKGYYSPFSADWCPSKLVQTAAWLCRSVRFVCLSYTFFSESLKVNSQPVHVWTVDGTYKPAQAQRPLAQGLIGTFRCSTGPKPRTFWEMKLRQTTCWKLCNTIFRTLYHVKSVIQGQCGSGIRCEQQYSFCECGIVPHHHHHYLHHHQGCRCKHRSADGSFQVSLKR